MEAICQNKKLQSFLVLYPRDSWLNLLESMTLLGLLTLETSDLNEPLNHLSLDELSFLLHEKKKEKLRELENQSDLRRVPVKPRAGGYQKDDLEETQRHQYSYQTHSSVISTNRENEEERAAAEKKNELQSQLNTIKEQLQKLDSSIKEIEEGDKPKKPEDKKQSLQTAHPTSTPTVKTKAKKEQKTNKTQGSKQSKKQQRPQQSYSAQRQSPPKKQPPIRNQNISPPQKQYPTQQPSDSYDPPLAPAHAKKRSSSVPVGKNCSLFLFFFEYFLLGARIAMKASSNWRRGDKSGFQGIIHRSQIDKQQRGRTSSRISRRRLF